MDGKNYASTAAEVSDLLKKNTIPNLLAGLYEDIKEQAEKVSRLGEIAASENATLEDKKKLASQSLELHTKLGSFLTELKTKQPDLYNSNVSVANMAVAFNMNANLLVKSIEDCKGDVLPRMIDDAFDRVVENASSPEERFRRVELENDLAKMLYFADLKAEFDRVHGSEADQKAWRTQILEELLSDRFDEKIKAVKETPLFKKVADNFRNAPGADYDAVACKQIIDNSISEMANLEYHKAYKHFGFGIQIEQQKPEVINPVQEIERLHLMADSIGSQIRDRDKLKDFNADPHFDTMDIKKRARLFGKFTDKPGQMIHEEEYKEFNRDRINKLQKEAEEKIKKEFVKEKKPFSFDSSWELPLKVIADADANIEAYEKEIASIEYSDKLRRDQKTKQISEIEIHRKNQIVKRDQVYNMLKTAYNPDHVKAALKEFKESYSSEGLMNKKINAEKEQIKNYYMGVEKDYLSSMGKYSDEIALEGGEYDIALAFHKGDGKDVAIREKREKRDEEYKKYNRNSYEPVNVNGKIVYKRLSYDETKNKMIESYRILKEKYKITDKQADRMFEIELENNDKLEQEYQKPILIERPDRSANKIATFNPKAPEKAEDIEIDYNNVEIADGIIRPGYKPVIGNKVIDMEPADALDYAIGFAEEHEKVFNGTKEYADILTEMREARFSLDNGEEPEKSIIRALNTISKMDRYIDRKNDEKDRGKESKNAYNRRIGMESARNMLYVMVDSLRIKNNLNDRDFVFEKSAADIENALATAKKKDPLATEIAKSLKKTPNTVDGYKRALTQMKAYLLENEGKMKGREAGLYPFRVNDDDSLGRRRIPAKENARVYRAVLRSFQNLERSYLDYTKANCPERMREALFDTRYYQPEGKTGLEEINQKLGTSAYQSFYSPDTISIGTPENVKEYKEQYEKLYKTYLNELKYKNLEGISDLNGIYDPNDALSSDGKHRMVDAALSVIYLEQYENSIKDHPEQFNAAQMEQGRQKFVSLIRQSEMLYYSIEKKVMKQFDLSENGTDLNTLTEIANQREKEIDTPDKFRKNIIPDAMADSLYFKINECQMNLLPDGKFNKNIVSQNLETINQNLKVAKALKISDKADAALNGKVLNTDLKGETFADTLKNFNNSMKEKMVHKQVEAPKGIRL